MILPQLSSNGSQTIAIMTSIPHSLTSSLSSTTTCDMLNNCRTLWDILQNCFGTVFVCIWAAIHPNMPQPRPPRKQWSSSWFIDACWDLADPLVIAFCALLMPEYILLWAMVQRLRAASLVRECRDASRDRKAQNARSRRFESMKVEAREVLRDIDEELSVFEIGNMHDLRTRHLHSRRIAMDEVIAFRSLVSEYEPTWTTTHGFFILMGGYHLYDGDMPICYLDPHKVVELVRDGVIVPPSEEEIQDRSKTDHISKIIILFQTSWFVVQCIARINQHLAITELELATLAYTILIAGIYVCWWSKPRGVAQPIRVSRNMWTPIMSAEPPHSEMDQWKNFNYQPRDIKDKLKVPMFYAGNPPHIQPIGAGIIAGAFGLPFAGVHFCAWHFEFPSRAEQWLWRIGCLLMIGCPLAASPTGIYAACYKKRKLSEFTGYFRNPFAQLFADIYRWEPTHQTYMLVHAVVLIPLYIIARWVVIVVAFTTLRSLHPSAYETVNWTTFIPHI